MTSASLSATEHVASLQAEQRSLSAELDADRIALAQAASAYDELSATYADGVLYASAGGDIGASVAPVGQTLSKGSGGIAAIFTGESFVLAYVPDAYLFEVSEGQTVGVRARNEVLNGRIDRILPFAESLPSDLQAPNRMLERGRLMRIALIDPRSPSREGRRTSGSQRTRCWREPDSNPRSPVAKGGSVLAKGKRGRVTETTGESVANLISSWRLSHIGGPRCLREGRPAWFAFCSPRSADVREGTSCRLHADSETKGLASPPAKFLNSGDRAERTLQAETPSPRNRELCESRSFDLGCDLTG